MDVSRAKPKTDGLSEDLFQDLAQLAGVPESWLTEELGAIADQKGLNLKQLEMHEIRALLGDYLMHLSIKEQDEESKAIDFLMDVPSELPTGKPSRSH